MREFRQNANVHSAPPGGRRILRVRPKRVTDGQDNALQKVTLPSFALCSHDAVQGERERERERESKRGREVGRDVTPFREFCGRKKNERPARRRRRPRPRRCLCLCGIITTSCSYRIIKHFTGYYISSRNLGWVDLDLRCSTVFSSCSAISAQISST